MERKESGKNDCAAPLPFPWRSKKAPKPIRNKQMGRGDTAMSYASDIIRGNFRWGARRRIPRMMQIGTILQQCCCSVLRYPLCLALQGDVQQLRQRIEALEAELEDTKVMLLQSQARVRLLGWST